jgi:type II secretory ATPase GspE/PulE/Tfp pilus assembly ATPase PilB-like protein
MLYRSIPSGIDNSLLQDHGISKSHSFALLSTLKFLGLLEDDGTPTSAFRLLQSSNKEFQSNLRKIVERAYIDLFSSIDGVGWEREHIRNFFAQNYSPATADKAAILFLDLCEQAGILAEGKLLRIPKTRLETKEVVSPIEFQEDRVKAQPQINIHIDSEDFVSMHPDQIQALLDGLSKVAGQGKPKEEHFAQVPSPQSEEVLPNMPKVASCLYSGTDSEGATIIPEQLDTAPEGSKESSEDLGEAPPEQGSVTPETSTSSSDSQSKFPAVDLKYFPVQPQAISLVPEHVAREHNVLPLAVNDESLWVAMQEPENAQLIESLANLTKKRIEPRIPLTGNLREAIDNYYKPAAQLTAQLEEHISQIAGSTPRGVTAEPSAGDEAISQAPIVRLVDMILTSAVLERASDIHIEPQKDKLRVRYRIDGVLQDKVSLPLSALSAIITRIKIMADLNIAERRRPQDGEFSTILAGKEVDFRIATIVGDHGEMATLRVLDKSLPLIELSRLGMSPAVEESYRRLLDSPFGMILIGGPTGSGKTTTLYASVNQLSSPGNNIMSIEDPVEYHFKDINQIQVNPQANITFAAGLRAIMRSDPDIILIGEIRDAETAQIAVQAALTGHLVLSSIHANDAAGALLRLVDMGIEPFLVNSAVIGSLSQRLIRNNCPFCQALTRASAAEARAYQEVMREERSDFFCGQGCNFCSGIGYRGRIGVFELLSLSDQIRKLIMQRASGTEIKLQALKEGMVSLQHDGMIKVKEGITTPQEILRNVFTLL